MTGTAQALAASTSAAAGNPLIASSFVQGGASGVNVTTASGSTTATPDGERFLFCVGSGGAGGYTFTWHRQNATNKTELESLNSAKAYVSWTGMTVGEVQSTTASCTITDALGATAISSTQVISITRTS